MSRTTRLLTLLQVLRGKSRPVTAATLASELSGRIVELPFSEGESFKKGDTLARFDCSAYQAQLNAAQAAFAKINRQTLFDLLLETVLR